MREHRHDRLAPAEVWGTARRLHTVERPPAPPVRSAEPHAALGHSVEALQQKAGNTAVSGLLAAVQRQPAPAGGDRDGAPDFDAEEYISDARSPGLTIAVANRAREAMGAGRRQEAVNVIVEALVDDGTIDRALLRGGRMRYDPALAQEGAARIPRFRLVEGRRVANPTRVRIGRTAFGRGLPWLFTSIIHEYRHVEQFQQTYSAERPLSGHNDWLEHRQEVDAYLHEIENARTTGLFANARQMRETWGRLAGHWMNVDRAGRQVLNDRYVAAHEVVREAVGPDVRLVFRPFTPAPAGAP